MTGGSPGQRAGPAPAGGVLDTGGIRPCVSSPQWTQAGGGRPRARGTLGQELGRWAPPTRLSSLQSSE